MTDLTGTHEAAAHLCTAADAFLNLVTHAGRDIAVYSASIDYRGATGTSIRIAVSGDDDEARQVGVDRLAEILRAQPRVTPAPTSSGAAYRVSGTWQGVGVDAQATLHNVQVQFTRTTTP